jgi:hypothetical protein
VPADPKLQNVRGRLRRCLSALAIVALLAGCGPDDGDRDAGIRAWLAAAEGEAEDRDRRALMSRIGVGYADARGYSRADVDRMLRYYLLRHKVVKLLTDIQSIRLQGDTAAEVAMTVGMAGTNGGFDLSADAWRFEFELEKAGGDWQLIGARWGRLGDEPR